MIYAKSKNRVAWLINGEIFIAPINAVLDINGLPMGSRWECSLNHWERYASTVYPDFKNEH